MDPKSFFQGDCKVCQARREKLFWWRVDNGGRVYSFDCDHFFRLYPDEAQKLVAAGVPPVITTS